MIYRTGLGFCQPRESTLSPFVSVQAGSLYSLYYILPSLPSGFLLQ